MKHIIEFCEVGKTSRVRGVARLRSVKRVHVYILLHSVQCSETCLKSTVQPPHSHSHSLGNNKGATEKLVRILLRLVATWLRFIYLYITRHAVCLSVCLSARLLKNACVDFDEMLRVDRCREMDELLSPIRIIVRMPEQDCFLQYRISAANRNFTSGKYHWRRAATANRGFKMVLFTEPSEDLCRQ